VAHHNRFTLEHLNLKLLNYSPSPHLTIIARSHPFHTERIHYYYGSSSTEMNYPSLTVPSSFSPTLSRLDWFVARSENTLPTNPSHAPQQPLRPSPSISSITNYPHPRHFTKTWTVKRLLPTSKPQSK